MLELDLATVEPLRRRPQAPAGSRAPARCPAEASDSTLVEQLQEAARARSTARRSSPTAPSSSPPSPVAPTPATPGHARRRPAGEEGRRERPEGPRYVKTSLAPGSRVVTDYYDKAGLTPYLDKLGFRTPASAARPASATPARCPSRSPRSSKSDDLVAAAVLSGNRNFEGRVNPLTSRPTISPRPPLVVAYALAGTVDIDLDNEPLGTNDKGEPVYLKDIWPTQKEVADAVAACGRPGHVPQAVRQRRHRPTRSGTTSSVTGGELFDWDEQVHLHPGAARSSSTLTTEHRPASRPIKQRPRAGDGRRLGHHRPHLPGRLIKKDSPAGKYLIDHGVAAGRLQQLRRPPRQRPRHDPRHLRQHPPQEPARPRHRRRRHHATCPPASR